LCLQKLEHLLDVLILAFREPDDGDVGIGEAGFQRVHQGHQFVHFRHDPALFGEGWERDFDGFQSAST